LGEQPRRQIGQHPRAQGGPGGGLEGEQHHQGILVDVVVEGPEELGGEQGAEAAAGQQGELGMLAAVAGRVAHERCASK